MTCPDLTDRARGVLLGLACGDALGAPIEFQLSGFEPVRDLTGGGMLSVRPGQTTDDTQMARALAQSIVDHGRFDPRSALMSYMDWAGRDGLGMGETVRGSLFAISRGASVRQATEAFHEQSGGKSAGNGTIMRCAPLAVALHGDLDDLDAAARADAQLTHFDPLAGEASAVLCRLIAAELRGEPAGSLSGDRRVEQALSANRRGCGMRARDQMGFCLTALAVAHRALRSASSLEDGLMWAVNLGGDADTNGAVAGALLGARFGASQIPSRWLDVLEERDDLVMLADALLSAR